MDGMPTFTRLSRKPFRTPSGRLDTDATARALGGLFLIGTGVDHLDLYLTGYRFIPVIGRLFVVQVVLAFGLGLALVGLSLADETARRRAAGALSWQQVVSGLGALLTIGTLALYLSSLVVGIFGFREIRTSAGILAAVLEIATFVLLSRVASSGVRPEIPAGLVCRFLAAAVIGVFLVSETAAVPPSPTAASTPPSIGQLAQSTPAVAVSQAGGPRGETSHGKVVTVVIKNFIYHPADPKAAPGEEILVKNDDSVAHTFSTPPGVPAADAFSSGSIPPGGSRELRAPSAPGHYKFICLIHQFMTGTLIVSQTA